MNAKEQLLSLKAGKTTGKILFYPIVMHYAARSANQKYCEFASDYRNMVSANINCVESIGMDAVTVMSDPYRETSAFGGVVTYPEDGVPRCSRQIIGNLEELEGLSKPDIENSERIMNCINGIKDFKLKLDNKVPIIGWVEGPMAEACDIIGVEEMLMRVCVDPEFATALMQKCLDYAKLFAKAQIDAGADIIGIGEAVCSQISAEMYDDLVFRFDKELIDFIHDNGAMVKLHICGNITHLLPAIRKANPDIVDIDSMVDMDDAFEQLGDKIIRCGNLNPVSMARDMGPDDVYAFSKNLIEKEKGRPFILSAGCEIPVGTPLENVLAMKNATLEL